MGTLGRDESGLAIDFARESALDVPVTGFLPRLAGAAGFPAAASCSPALRSAGAATRPAHRRHAFQYFLTPPADAAAVLQIDGVEELNAQRGLTVELFKHAGDPLDWREGTLTYVGLAHGSGTDHDDVLRRIDQVNARCTSPYRPANPPVASTLSDTM